MRLDRIRVIYWRAGNGCEGLWWSRVNRNVWGFQDTENGDGAPSTSPCLPGWVVAEVLFASLGMMWTWMVGMENHRLLLFKPSNCFVARIFPFKRDDLYLVGWLQKKGMLVCVWVSGRWELLEIPFFYPVTTDVNCLLNGKIHPKLTQSSCQNAVLPLFRISQRNIIKYCWILRERKEKQPTLKAPETEPKHQSGATSCVAAVPNLHSETLAEKPPLCKSRGSAAGNHRAGLEGTWKKDAFGQNFLPFFCTKCHFQNNCFLPEWLIFIFLIFIQMWCCRYGPDGFMRITFTNDYVAKPHNTWSLLWNDVNIFLSTFLTVGSSSLFSTEIKLNLQSLLITFINTVFLCGPHALPIGASEHL